MVSQKKYIILGDPFTSGHHETYLRMYTKLFVDLGYNVSIFSPKEKEIWSDLPGPYKKYVTPHHLASYIPIRFFASHRANHVISTSYLWLMTTVTVWSIVWSKRQFPVLVFFSWLDHYLDPHIPTFSVDIFFPFAWSGIYFHPTHSSPRLLQSRRCRSVGILDETVGEELQADLPSKPVMIIPDIIDQKTTDKRFRLYKEIKKRAGGRKIVGCLGPLERRKSILFLSRVAYFLRNDNYYFVFIGALERETFSPEELPLFEKFLHETPRNCFIYPKRIVSDRQFNALVDCCDVLFLGYLGFNHSSNMLTRAGMFGKPSIVYDTNRCMAGRVRKFHLGTVIKEDNIFQCVRAVKKLSATSPVSTKAFRSQFSYNNFRSTLKILLSHYV